jgi:putative redox protein
MKAIARRADRGPYIYSVTVRDHELTVDEPVADGGQDAGPGPQEVLAASLASCTAITMDMYAQRKGWDIGPLEVECEYESAQRGYSTFFHLTLRMSDHLTADQRERLEAIAARCPVHRTLEGPVRFKQRVELTSRA